MEPLAVSGEKRTEIIFRMRVISEGGFRTMPNRFRGAGDSGAANTDPVFLLWRNRALFSHIHISDDQKRAKNVRNCAIPVSNQKRANLKETKHIGPPIPRWRPSSSLYARVRSFFALLTQIERVGYLPPYPLSVETHVPSGNEPRIVFIVRKWRYPRGELCQSSLR